MYPGSLIVEYLDKVKNSVNGRNPIGSSNSNGGVENDALSFKRDESFKGGGVLGSDVE